MLLNILKIDSIRSSDIMIPELTLAQLKHDSFEKVLEVFIKEAHSELLHENNVDNIIGMVHIKDLVNYQNQNTVDGNFLRDYEIEEIPPSMPVLDLLLKMQMTRSHGYRNR